MTDWVPPHGLGPLCFQTRWSFIRIQYVSPWNHVARRDLDCSGHGSGLSQSRGNSSGTCCKSKCQNNDTPRETRTLLLVNTHHNLRLLSLNRIVFYLMGAWALDTKCWAKLKSCITLYALTQPFMTRRSLPRNVINVAFRRRGYQKFIYNINVFLNPGNTGLSVQQLW